MSERDEISPSPRILAPGRNCWTDQAPLEDCALLVDGREYYRAFYNACRAARKYILIAGWKFNSGVRLLRGDDVGAADGPIELAAFLRSRVCANPELQICILAWDYSMIYAWEWEWSLETKFSDPDGRMQFRFDSHHALGGSHHQKFVVVDGRIAFVGGFDFNGDDWDDREHAPENAERGDCGKHHGPYHDVQACLVGGAAAELARYFRARWHDAGHGDLELPPPATAGGAAPGLPIHARQAGLSVSQPLTLTNPRSILQIRELYRDAILAARELVYLENQYFTADNIAEALTQRMRDQRLLQLDIVVVLPKQLAGWVEAATLEPARLRLLDSLSAIAAQTGHRFGVYYSAAHGSDGSEVATLIHSKLLVVDDRFLTVGSANTSNRSQGLDTELNASWETLDPTDALGASIQQIRVDLLAEHCGAAGDRSMARDLRLTRGLVQVLDEWADTKRGRLRHLTRDAVLEERAWLGTLEQVGFSLDPGHPVVEEFL